ncbi:MAG: flap structure-specific endonuclease, partial [Candidatus Hadarchaeota archaeon]|nr:flap structure-specific endonuclease [Candidatus Hadarchaeota archaeon]
TEFQELLKKLEINRQQLVAIGMLVGTDYNAGIKGVGPKKALGLIKKHGSIKEVARKLEEKFEVDPREVEKIFLKPNTIDSYKLEWGEPNPDGIKEFLCEKHDFSESRVQTGIDRLLRGAGERAQESLEKWFG